MCNYDHTREHKYPCIAWEEERACAICRGIAEERSYWSKEDWQEYREEQKKQGAIK